jgi:hypothetical protein
VLVALAHRHPIAVVLAAGSAALLSLFLTTTRLEFHTNRADLISAGNRYKQLDERDRREFVELPERVVVVIQGEDPEVAKAFAAALGQRWERDPKIEKVLYRIDLAPLRDKGLLYLSPEALIALRERLETRQDLLRELAASPTVQTMFGLIDRELTSALVSQLFTGGLVEGDEESTPIDFTPLVSLLRSMNQWLEGSRNFRSPWDTLFTGGNPSASHDGYLWSDDKRLLFVLANPRRVNGEFNRFQRAVQGIRDEVKDVQRDYPGLQVGITGRAVLESDEMAVTQRDMTIASLLSLAGVTLLFVLFFREVVRPALAGITLVIGLCWSLGFATLTVGHLNILTIVFLPMLIGLGDYSVHFLTRYEEERAAGRGSLAALEHTLAGTGGAILAAALTAALGFFALLPTGFKGLVELGFLSGSGILLTALATFTVLPALLALSERKRREDPRLARQDPSAQEGYLPWVRRHPRATLAASGLLLGLSALGLSHVRYDFNLLHLQAAGTESVTWTQKIFESAKRSVLFEEVVAGSLEEVRRKTAALKALPSVAGVESIASVIPEDQPRKLEILRALRPLLSDVPAQADPAAPVDVDALRTILGRIKFKMGEASGTPAAGEDEPFATERREVRHLIEAFIETTDAMSPAEVRRALGTFQAELVGDLEAKLALLRQNLAAKGFTVEDLPPELRARYIGKTGQYRLFVYPSEDIWEYEALSRFVQDIQSVDPDAHGTPVTTFEFLRQMKEGYQWAALYAAAGVLFLTFLTFRAVRPTLLALIPLAVGAGWTLGLMGLLDVPFNAANLLFLPLIVGVGIDNGIYVVDRFRETENGDGTPAVLPRSTGRAISLASLTTIVGFGSLMLSSHRGIYSLGLVIALGVGSVLVASLTTLPSLLALVSKRAAARQPIATPVGIKDLRIPPKGPVVHRLPGMVAERSGPGRALPATMPAGDRREAA